MPRERPLLVDRIAAAMQRAAVPVPSEVIAREHLGLHWIDRAKADLLLDPLLGADERFRRTPLGWTLARSARPAGDPSLRAAALVVFAPITPPVVAAVRSRVDAPPLFAVAMGGRAECDRARMRGLKDIPELTLDLVAIRKRAFGESGPREPWEVAEHLGIPHVEANDPPSIARLVATIWMRSIDDLEGESVTTLSDLERVIDAVLEPTDFAGKAFGPQDVLALPDAPGIYRFADRRRRTLYVGRSAALRARVSSYFLGSPRDDKDRAIREHAVHLVTRRSASAVDAWIDEARAIERFAPRLNTQRAVHLDVSRDGVLLVPAADDESAAIAFVVCKGRLARRLRTAGGPNRVRAFAETATQVLFEESPAWSEASSKSAERDAALVDAWSRAHPDAPFLQPAIDGDAVMIARAIVAELSAWGLAPRGS